MQSSRVLALSFLRDHPDEAAGMLELRPPAEVASLLDEVPPQLGASLLQRMTSSGAAACLGRMSTQRAVAVAEILPLGSAAVLLRQLDAAVRDPLLGAMSRKAASSLQRILHYPEGTAGALMDPRVTAFPQDITVENTRARLRRAPAHSSYYLYVVDRDQHLLGVLTVPELFLAERRDLLAAAMHSPVERLPGTASQRAVLEHPGWRAYHALPVVDQEGRFLGVIQLEALRALERADSPEASRAAAMETAMRLGELLWIGLASLFTGLVGHGLPEAEANKRVRRD